MHHESYLPIDRSLRLDEIARVLVCVDHVASFYQRHDRENLPFSIHLDFIAV
jgi:hypothetical protein